MINTKTPALLTKGSFHPLVARASLFVADRALSKRYFQLMPFHFMVFSLHATADSCSVERSIEGYSIVFAPFRQRRRGTSV